MCNESAILEHLTLELVETLPSANTGFRLMLQCGPFLSTCLVGLVWYDVEKLRSLVKDAARFYAAAILPRVSFGLALGNCHPLLYRIPSGMMSLAVMLPPSYHVLGLVWHWEIAIVGQRCQLT
jgi:hypothetical protein